MKTRPLSIPSGVGCWLELKDFSDMLGEATWSLYTNHGEGVSVLVACRVHLVSPCKGASPAH